MSAFDSGGMRCLARDAVSIWRYRYDAQGHQTRFEAFDTSVKPALEKDWIPRVDYAHDEQGNMIS